MQKTIAIGAAVVAALLLGATWWVSRPAGDDVYAECRNSTVGTGSSSIGGPFTLVDHNGTTVTEADVLTKPTLLYFGYTFCPDVCPLDTARNADALDLLVERGYDAQIAFISVDHERDNPERMRDFSALFSDRMIGLTGSEEQIRAASQAYKTYFKKEEGGDPDYFLIDHSTFTYLVLPEIGFVEFFRRDETDVSMADRVGCFLDKTQ